METSKKSAGEEPREPSVVQERPNWRIAYRDAKKVAQAIYAGEEKEEMHELSQERPVARI